MRPWRQVVKDLVSRPHIYFAVPSSNLEKSLRTSDEDSLDDQEGARALLGDDVYPLYHPYRRFGVFSIIMAVSVLALTAAGAFLLGKAWQPHLDEKCMRHSSTYSTVMKQVSNKLHDVKFNGTLGKNSQFTGHWGDPNEAMDREWNRWGFVKYASFSRDEFAAMGMDLEGSARFTEEYGGGYIGFLEISHKMHCLNVIRQAYHREYYERPENKKWATWLNDRPITVKVHINHCFEMLRQNIMCSADVGVIPHHWVKDIPDPFANFNTVHKCRDLDSVAKWIEDHEVAPPPENGYPMPADSKVWEKAP
ncbi:hypothetical protein H0G86_013310 [Trichoderma simmonsii]|uniref:Tat pathway signal sequence n=1 Tax=Trichoderma simmonsii TaxID=1491479 RepID=A0A8G0LVC5_9HYPO|nr:hypothetical protein H0G86_013310 [Trichoderma simmonsii]